MRELYRYELEYDRVWKYIQSTIDQANALSSALLKLINFEKGTFFTLLPEDANNERLYEFEAGLILHQNPTENYLINGKEASYTKTPKMDGEVAEFILNKLNSDHSLACLFDDVTRHATDKYHMELFRDFGKNHEMQVYYFINNKYATIELITACLQKSCSFWHSLCILFENTIDFSDNKKISLTEIDAICINIKLIIIGAYDGEGYIFWERVANRETIYKSTFEI
jgi:hypothetical protein